MSDQREGLGAWRGPIAWMALNSIAANLLMFLLLGGGLWSAYAIQKEVFPQFQLDIVEIRVGYPGAAPSEVEQGILNPIEGAVRGVDGIREITSEAREGRGEVMIEIVAGYPRMKVFQDIDQAVNRIRTFPDQIDQPEVRLQSERREAMQVVLYGPVDVWTLRKLAEQLRDQLQANDQITQVELRRVPEYVTHVEIPRQQLRAYGLTLSDVAEIIRGSSQDVAAGSLQTTAGEILLRVKARKQFAEEFASIQIVSGREGPAVTLGDIATIRDGFEEVGFHSQFSQTPSVELDIFRVGSQSPGDIAEAVEQSHGRLRERDATGGDVAGRPEQRRRVSPPASVGDGERGDGGGDRAVDPRVVSRVPIGVLGDDRDDRLVRRRVAVDAGGRGERQHDFAVRVLGGTGDRCRRCRGGR